jgi:hypothetical protein
MAGRPLTRARQADAERKLREATTTPTPRRTEPAPYSDDLAPEVIELGRNGFSPAEIADHLAVDEQTLEQWGEAHEALRDAMSRARTACKAWWERQARVAVATGDTRFAAGAWSHLMRAKFPEYDEKRGFTVQIDVSKFVVLNLADSPDERMPGGSKALSDKATVRLPASHTVEGEVISGSVAGETTSAAIGSRGAGPEA